MGKKQLKDTLELVGVAAIIASLVFVAFEIRQNTDAVRSTVVQAVSQQSYDAIVFMLENEDIFEAQAAARNGSADPEQRRKLNLYYSALMRLQLNRYMQSEIGILSADTLLDLGGRSGVYTDGNFAKYWANANDSYSEGFQKFVEENLMPLNQAESSE